MKIELSKNTELVKKIDEGLKQNQKEYGKRYCPCVIPSLYMAENNADYICPCKEFLESTELGECHCGKYVKTEL